MEHAPISNVKILFEEHSSTRRKPKNIKDADLHLFQHEFKKRIRQTDLVQLNHAFVIEDIVLNPRNFRTYIAYTRLHPLQLKSLLRRFVLLLKPGVELREGSWIIDNWSLGYFHWFTDAVPRLLASENVCSDCPVILPDSYKDTSYIYESLDLLSKSIFFYDPAKKLKVNKLFLPSHTAETGNYNKHLINEVRRRFIGTEQSMHGKRIYLSREKAGRRKITNEVDVQALLRNYGYEIHCFEDYSLNKQIEIMRKTEYMVGLHGAGLTNMLFMPEGGKVLELRNRHDFHNNCYFTLASDLNHHYYYQLNEGNMPDTFRVDLTVDLTELATNLESMEKKGAQDHKKS